MMALARVEPASLSVKGALLYYQCSANGINKTPKIISIKPANIRLLHVIKKKERKRSLVQ